MVRMPVVAGSFYEGREDILRERLRQCFLRPPGPGRLPEGNPGSTRALKAVIAPHAGYMYSGYPAAHTYLRVFEDGRPEHIVIFGPNHTGFGARLAVCEDDWQTPLGVVKYDRQLGPLILDNNALASRDCIAHSSEHSIEVQLPFLQYVFGEGLSFVPICISDQRYEVCESIGKTVGELAREMDILVIASSDFTHYEPAEVAKKKDTQAMELLEYLDPEGFLKFVRQHRISICGAGPITAALVAAKERDATTFRLLKYTTSGDVTGDHHSVVAYVAAAFE
ncbi:MAG: AmmeMemoRadiSam system protein B [Candidatus Thorarchaeota archaeon]